MKLRPTPAAALVVYLLCYAVLLLTDQGPFGVLSEIPVPLWIPGIVAAAGSVLSATERVRRASRYILAAAAVLAVVLGFFGFGPEAAVVAFLALPPVAAVNGTLYKSVPAGMLAYGLLLGMLLGFHTHPMGALLFLLSVVLWAGFRAPSGDSAGAAVSLGAASAVFGAVYFTSAAFGTLSGMEPMPGNVLLPTCLGLLVLAALRILFESRSSQP